ncbi:MAG: alpha/beta hydrolase [Clostridiales bacterium]|jgi:acetyl esterase/lipase|nr:alpha/beta hydrolase [Clostridiales bacterium]
MKEILEVHVSESSISLFSGITFAQVPYWFPNIPVKDLKLDFLREYSTEKKPLIVWLCGGAWITMDRGAHIPWLINFAKNGFAVASAEYRMSNSAHFPAQLEDVKSAIRYFRKNADTYGIDKDRIAVAGESAGGYLAAMAGVTSGDKSFDVGENLDQDSSVQAVVDFYGPTDFLSFPQNPQFQNSPTPEAMLLGYNASSRREEAEKSSALQYASKNSPPFFIAHGTNDGIVGISQSEILHEKLERVGARSDFYPIKGAGHATPHFYQSALQERITAFLKEVL